MFTTSENTFEPDYEEGLRMNATFDSKVVLGEVAHNFAADSDTASHERSIMLSKYFGLYVQGLCPESYTAFLGENNGGAHHTKVEEEIAGAGLAGHAKSITELLFLQHKVELKTLAA